MLELYLESPGELKLREIPSPAAPQDNEVKIKIRYGGICGSDVHVYKGEINYAKYPIRPGHEVIGTITEAGSNTHAKVGDRVVIEPNTFCGSCEFCNQGKTNICANKQPLGISCPGVFAQEVIVEDKYAVVVPSDVPDEKAVLLEPLAVTVHAVKKANIKKGMSVAVMGSGTIGLLAAAVALYFGGDITVLDINPDKLVLAKQLGSIRTLDSREVKDEKFDVVIESAGIKATIEQGIQMVKPGGQMVSIGIYGGQVDYPAIYVTRNEITIHGTIIYTLDDFQDAIRYLQDPAFSIKPVLSKIVSLSQYRQAFEDAASGNFAKIALDFQKTK